MNFFVVALRFFHGLCQLYGICYKPYGMIVSMPMRPTISSAIDQKDVIQVFKAHNLI